jgi:hypothetical protein
VRERLLAMQNWRVSPAAHRSLTVAAPLVASLALTPPSIRDALMGRMGRVGPKLSFQSKTKYGDNTRCGSTCTDILVRILGVVSRYWTMEGS